ncbi:DUF402 domain-containing protein [Dictyobacter arantiisoli]|uniref:DUF402 domain-containing protein n=1 Tax=Dictyobacter arantiisoli TaxID=2014874 RepID=A0A5A5TAC2_9CHLR|nr:DUF402 domain-containing protein [Dictyobacter arantiisoli]GCF07929.1 hypothetical protein KDI_14930 [Dictyobacter arantiisoli]
MITIIKLDPLGREKVRYTGDIIHRSPHGVVVQANWTMTERDLGYTRFEPGDRFIEYYYTNRWFNIFDIACPDGVRKGWYCNIAEPARILATHIEQVDLFLDVWVDPRGNPLILDEDEFEAATMLHHQQRQMARQGLQTLLHLLENRTEVFSSLAAFS